MVVNGIKVDSRVVSLTESGAFQRRRRFFSAADEVGGGLRAEGAGRGSELEGAPLRARLLSKLFTVFQTRVE